MTLSLPVAGKASPGDEVDARLLAEELADRTQGDVRFDAAYRAIYSTDASQYRQVPVGVVLPRSKDDVERTVAVCRGRNVPVLGRGGGTSLAGQCCNVAVVLDFSRHMNRVLDVDPDRRLARVEPGCVLDDLRDAAAEHGLTFGPDPATHDRCVLGGMIGNNSCGIHSVHAARHTGPRTSDNLHRLEVLTYDGARFWTGPTTDEELERIVAEGGRRGEIHAALRKLRDRWGDDVRERFPEIPRRVSGYNLDELLPEKSFHVARALAGSESTCALFLEAELHLIPRPRATSLVVIGFRDVYHAADAVPGLIDEGLIGLEAFDHRLVDFMARKGMTTRDSGLLPQGDSFLLAQLGADTADEALARAEALGDAVRGHSLEGFVDLKVFPGGPEEEEIWALRESGLGATAFVPGARPSWPGWEDTAVPPARLGDYLREMRALMNRFGYEGAFYGHFGQGLLHSRIDFELDHRGGLERWMRFSRDVAALVSRYGGSLSGEHGDGQARGALLGKLYGPRVLEAFRAFKTIWDPEGRMNPGKLIDPYLPDQNLFTGPEFDPVVDDTRTWFAYPSDKGSFSEAMIRCVGVGKCRREGGGTMCPSYMATRDEMHTTRGRARALFEMVRGESLTEGWKSEAVHEALDLCLSCKGCKSDCPVHVDMATYKAEFNAHYYAGRLRPRSAYAFGLIRWWARLASRAPGVANGLMERPALARWMKRAAGVHPERTLPRFAERTFSDRFRAELAGVNPGGRKVVFWPDTFNDHFHPSVALAGARTLQSMGYRVALPPGSLCCGRPLYEFGFLGLAKKWLRRILDSMAEDIRAGVPVVGVEPSCVSTFRDELGEMFPNDRLARQLSRQTFLLGEFLERFAPDVELPKLGGSALLHGHCHQKAVLDFGADRKVLERMGVEVRIPDSGCCGMAGPFGFEEEHYDVAQACAERVLLPEVRRERGEDPSTLVVTDGFSCRTMIEQNVEGVRPLNLSEVVWRAIEASGRTRGLGSPRRAYPFRPERRTRAGSGGVHERQRDAP